jgi:hypothetical protein
MRECVKRRAFQRGAQTFEESVQRGNLFSRDSLMFRHLKPKKKDPKTKAQVSPTGKGPPVSQSATTGSQTVYIRVRQSLVSPNPTTANPTIVNPPPSIPQLSGHLYLIQGSIDDIGRYAGATVDWIIKVAHFICDPSGAGEVYTHRTGTALYWYDRDRDADWTQVNSGDALSPGIYEFVTAGPIQLSRISERQSRSVTSLGSESSSRTFRRHLEVRDGGCVVTRATTSLIASHLIPKRMGTDGAKDVFTRFVGAIAALNVHRFHPEIGVFLFSALDGLVDRYHLGFYHVAVSNPWESGILSPNTATLQGQTYTLHNFDTNHPNLPYTGVTFPGLPNPPPLHLHSVTLSVHGGSEHLPPKGVFDWHYLQCVVQRFGTDQFKTVPNIAFFVCPFKTADDDSEDEFEDNDHDKEPPCPTYRFDRFMAKQWNKHREQEDFRGMAQWSSGIISGVE